MPRLVVRSIGPTNSTSTPSIAAIAALLPTASAVSICGMVTSHSCECGEVVVEGHPEAGRAGELGDAADAAGG